MPCAAAVRVCSSVSQSHTSLLSGLSPPSKAPLSALTHLALIVLEHQRRLDHVGERRHLRVAKHQLEEREHTLGRCRVGSERPNDLHRERPRRELLAVVGPKEEDALGERVHVIVIVGCAGARGEVGGQLILEPRDVLSD